MKIEELPQNIQEAIKSPAITARIMEIGFNNGLTDDQAGELQYIVTQTLFGLSHPSEFVKKIEHTLKIPESQARKIGQQINVETFRPLKESIREIYHIGKAKPETLPVQNEISEIPEEEKKYIDVVREVNQQVEQPNDIKIEKGQNIERNRIISDIENPKGISDENPVSLSRGETLAEQQAEVNRVPTNHNNREARGSEARKIAEEKPIKQYTNDPYREPIE